MTQDTGHKAHGISSPLFSPRSGGRVRAGGFLLCLVSCVLCHVLSGCTTINPVTGREEFIVFTTPAEVLLGQEIHAQMNASVKFSHDAAASARLARIGQKVAQVADRQDYQYHFYLIDSDEVNAFTTPGGYVYFYTGLYKKLPSDDEVAAVIAHEIGHCSARHVVKKFQAAMGYNFVGGLVFGQIQNKIALQVARLGADTLMNVAMSAYSRSDEFQADKLGVRYMYLAGYAPEGMVRTFQVLGEASEGKGERGSYLFRSHPYMKDRVEAVEKEIELVRSRY